MPYSPVFVTLVMVDPVPAYCLERKSPVSAHMFLKISKIKESLGSEESCAKGFD